MLSQEEHYSPWRKQGFLCKPYHGDRGDGMRFATEYLDAADRLRPRHSAAALGGASEGTLRR